MSTETDMALTSKHMIDPIILRGERHMICAPEGGIKTMLAIGLAVHIAAGKPFLGMSVIQAPVLLIDEETPLATLESRLDRFSNGLGIGSFRDLPIEVLSKSGYRFHLKTSYEQKIIPAIQRLFKKYPYYSDLLITTDSV